MDLRQKTRRSTLVENGQENVQEYDFSSALAINLGMTQSLYKTTLLKQNLVIIIQPSYNKTFL